MANNSQRGYLSGILQRGAKPIEQASSAAQRFPDPARATPVWFSDQNDFSDPPAVDTPTESRSSGSFTAAEQSFDESGPVAHPRPIKFEHENSDTTEGPLERFPPEALIEELSEPDSPRTDSSPELTGKRLERSANPLLPTRFETQDVAAPPQPTTDFWERRTPRLISAGRADNPAAHEDAATKINEAKAGVGSGNRQTQRLASPTAAAFQVQEQNPGPAVVGPESSQSPEKRRQLTSPLEHASVNSESIESIRAAGAGRVTLTEDLKSQPNGALPELLPPQESRQSMPRRLLTSVAAAPSLVPNVIEPALGFRPTNAQREPQGESLVRHASGRTTAEEQFARRTGRQPQYQPGREEPARLTINRLDVQILNQSAIPVLPAPAAAPAARAPQPDLSGTLDRYHLGHLNAIF